MFKRSTKMTALLVAAASVMSMVPAMAATTRLGVRDGHITGGAIAYTDGKYIYDGYRTDEDNTGIYYNNGSDAKEKLNEDLEHYNLVGKFGTKYAYTQDGNDQYLVDLSTGKIVEDETPEEKIDTVKANLRSQLKKTDRYANTSALDTMRVGDARVGTNDNYAGTAFGNKFGEVWYTYSAEGDNDTNKTVLDLSTGATKAVLTIKLPDTLKVGDSVQVPGAGSVQVTQPSQNVDSIRAQFATDVMNQIKNVDVNGRLFLELFDVSKSNDNKSVILTAKKAGALDSTDVTDIKDIFNTKTVAATNISSNYFNDAKTRLINLGAPADKVNSLTSSYLSTFNAVATARQSKGINDVPGTSVAVTPKEALALAGVNVDDATSIMAEITKFEKATDKTAYMNELLRNIQPKVDAEVAKKLAAEPFYVSVNDGKNAQDGTKVTTLGRYFGYVNESGKYIDISSTANVYVYDATEGKTIKIKEFNKENEDYKITVVPKQFVPLAQDKDNIYTRVVVDIVKDGSYVGEQNFILKTSKAQGDKKDDAYVPKNVEAYQMDNNTIYDDGDANDAYDIIMGEQDNFVQTNISVKDGKLYLTGVKNDGDHDKVKVYEVSLKKDKIDTKDGKEEDVDTYIAKKTSDTDADLKLGTKNTAVAYDVDGNTWLINKGTITKIEKTTKTDMYTTDRSYTQIDVYDDKNLVAWDKDEEAYTTVQEGTKVTQGEAAAVTVAPAAPVTGWVKGTDGTWTFNDYSGTKVTSKWINDKGSWYYLKADGVMATGWLNDNGTWYYLQGSGAMATGWLNDNGTWYYLNGSGAMLSNTTVDGYKLGANGAWVK